MDFKDVINTRSFSASLGREFSLHNEPLTLDNSHPSERAFRRILNGFSSWSLTQLEFAPERVRKLNEYFPLTEVGIACFSLVYNHEIFESVFAETFSEIDAVSYRKKCSDEALNDFLLFCKRLVAESTSKKVQLDWVSYLDFLEGVDLKPMSKTKWPYTFKLEEFRTAEEIAAEENEEITNGK